MTSEEKDMLEKMKAEAREEVKQKELDWKQYQVDRRKRDLEFRAKTEVFWEQEGIDPDKFDHMREWVYGLCFSHYYEPENGYYPDLVGPYEAYYCHYHSIPIDLDMYPKINRLSLEDDNTPKLSINARVWLSDQKTKSYAEWIKEREDRVTERERRDDSIRNLVLGIAVSLLIAAILVILF